MSYFAEVVLKDVNGNKATITDTGQLHIVLMGVIDTDNSTDVPLGIDAAFTGDWTETLEYAGIIVTLNSDKISADDGLEVLWSTDGINTDSCDEFTFENVTKGKTYTFQPAAKYVKIIYTNGGTEQTYFRLQTQLKKTNFKPSTHRIQDDIVDEDDATLQKSVITGKNPQDDFVNFTSTMAGNFKISLEEFENQVSVNSNTQLRTTLFNSTGAEIKTDNATSAIAQIPYPHHEIHEGEHYFVSDSITLGSAATQVYLFTTPGTTKWAHMLFSIDGTAITTYDIYEDSDRIGTTLQTLFNNNRNSGNISGNTLHKGISGGTTDGTLILSYSSGTSGGVFRSPSETRSDEEIILKQDTKYLIRITSGTAANLINLKLLWYEHTDDA